MVEKPFLRVPKNCLFTPWCNGSTTVFGTVCPGSNPGGVALLNFLVFLFFEDNPFDWVRKGWFLWFRSWPTLSPLPRLFLYKPSFLWRIQVLSSSKIISLLTRIPFWIFCYLPQIKTSSSIIFLFLGESLLLGSQKFKVFHEIVS